MEEKSTNIEIRPERALYHNTGYSPVKNITKLMNQALKGRNTKAMGQSLVQIMTPFQGL